MASAGEKSLAVGHIPGFQIDPKLTCMPLLLQYYVFTALHRIFAVLTIVSEYWQALLLLSLCNHIRTRNRLSII